MPEFDVEKFVEIARILNLPEDEYDVLMKRLPTPELEVLIADIGWFQDCKVKALAEANRRGWDVDKIIREADANA